MTQSKKDLVKKLLKGIETGDPEAAAVVNEAKYIQHNPLTRTGSEGLAELFKRLSQFSPRVRIARIFEDGDIVFAHTDYDFNVVEIGFEVFRFEDGFAVEHWDNLQHKPDNPNRSGHTMIDGLTEVADLDKTEVNRERVQSFIDEVLIRGQLSKLSDYIDAETYTEHNPHMEDGLSALHSTLAEAGADGNRVIQYERMHRLLAEGNFLLSICEGYRDGVHTSFFDLFRVTDGKIVEHWDTTYAIPPRSQWVNSNGKF